MLYENIDSKKKFVKSVLKNTSTKDYFRNDFFTCILGKISLTAKGEQVRNEIIEALRAVDKVLANLNEATPDKIKEIIDNIHANILLSDLFDLLKKIDALLKKNRDSISQHTGDTFGVDFI